MVCKKPLAKLCFPLGFGCLKRRRLGEVKATVFEQVPPKRNTNCSEESMKCRKQRMKLFQMPIPATV